MAILIYPVYIIQTLCVFFLSLSNSLLYFANVFSFLFQIFENSETLWTSIYIYRIYIDFPRNRGNAWIFACRFASMATLDTCPETRRWAARLPCETHIKAVDKRKGALIVRRSSIHEVAGYGYTYVLRCAYTDPVCTRFPHTYTRDVAHEYLRFVYSSTEYFLQTFIESWAPSIFLRLSLKLILSWKPLRALNFLYHVYYNRGADRIFHTESPIQLHI